jgi:hypothetical protein
MEQEQQDNHANRQRQTERAFVSKNTFPHHISLPGTLSALLLIAGLRIQRWLGLLVIRAGSMGWPPWTRHERKFRRWEVLNKNKKMNLHNRNTLKPAINLLIESRLRILRWLSMLLLSAGLAGWWHRIAEKARFRHSRLRQYSLATFSRKHGSEILKAIDQSMGTQLRILHWLSLLLLSEGIHWQASYLEHFSWFLNPEQTIKPTTNIQILN